MKTKLLDPSHHFLLVFCLLVSAMAGIVALADGDGQCETCGDDDPHAESCTPAEQNGGEPTTPDPATTDPSPTCTTCQDPNGTGGAGSGAAGSAVSSGLTAWVNATYPPDIVTGQQNLPPNIYQEYLNWMIQTGNIDIGDSTQHDLTFNVSLGTGGSGVPTGGVAIDLSQSQGALTIDAASRFVSNLGQYGQASFFEGGVGLVTDNEGNTTSQFFCKVWVTSDLVIRVTETATGLAVECFPRSVVAEGDIPPSSTNQNLFTSYSGSIANYTITSGQLSDGTPAHFVQGTYLGGPYTATFAQLTPPGSPVVVNETTVNGIRTRISEARVPDYLDIDGYQRVRTIERFKADLVNQGEWIPHGETVMTYRTLADGTEVLLEKQIKATAAETLVTTYTYDEALVAGGMLNPSFGKLLTQQNPDGSWVKMEYGTDGQLWRTYKPWAQYDPGLADATPTNCWVKVELAMADQFDSEWEWESNKTYISGILVEHNAVETTYVGTEVTAVQQTLRHRLDGEGAAESFYVSKSWFYDRNLDDGTLQLKLKYDEAGVPTSVRRKVQGYLHSTSGLFVAHPDGPVHAAITTGPLSAEARTVPGKTVRQIIVKNPAGRAIIHYSMVATSAAYPEQADYSLLDGVRFTYSMDGRLVSKTSLDSSVLLESTSYDDNAHSRTVTDAQGVSTTYTTDSATGQETAKVRHAVPADASKGVPYVPPVTETSAYSYNNYGIIAETSLKTGGALSVSRTTARDSAGRTLLIVDEQGRETSYQYTMPQDSPEWWGVAAATTYQKVVTLRPGNLAGTAIKFTDGQAYLTTSPGQPDKRIWRQLNEDGTVLHVTAEGDAALGVPLRATATLRGAGGAVLSEAKGAWQNFSFSPFETTFVNHHDNAGRLVRVSKAGLADEITVYDAFGEVQYRGVDMNGDGILTPASSDVLTEATRSIQQQDNDWWQVVTESRYVTPGSAADKITTSTWKKLTAGNAASRTVNADGSVITTATAVDRAAALVTTTRTISRDGEAGESTTTKTVAGLVVAETLLCCPDLITHGYDALGRRTSTLHPEKGLSQTHYNALGQTEWTQTAIGETSRTSYTYYPASHASAGRIHTVTAPGGALTTYEYDTAGRIILQTGSGTYPIGKDYDEQGRLVQLRTWREAGAASPVPDITTWNYNPITGQLESKADHLGRATTYGYTEAGQIHTRTWARTDNGSPLVATYTYNDAGQLTDIDYSDSTPDVHYTLDRLGRQITITDVTGTRTLARDGPGGELGAVAYASDGLLASLTVDYGFDDKGRKDTLLVKQGTTTLTTTGYTHVGATEKLASVSHGGATASYDWGTEVLGLPGSVSYSGAGLTGTRTPDAAGRLHKIEWTVENQNNAIISSHTYTLDGAGKRTAADREDGTKWDYGYNDRGEVTSAVHRNAEDEALPGRTFGYEFDDIGNRKTATTTALDGNVQTTTYQPNALNQYDTITRPNPLRRLIQGLANEQADVEVFMATSPPNPPAQGANQTATAANLSWPSGINPDSLIVARIPLGGAPFYSEAALDTGSGPAWRYIVVRATRAGAGVNGQNLATLRQGWMYFAPQNEALLYDEDGNLTEDARWHYRWDGENRLSQMEEKARTTGPARQRLTFTYDSQSRRVRKLVESFDIQTSSFGVVSDLRFLYDDWNLIAEFKMNLLQPSSLSLQTSFAWGYDLSATEQGAGGVGGLLFAKSHSTTVNNSQPSSTALLAPTYDGNGNITAYLEVATGQAKSRHEYDAFGNELSVDLLLTSPSSINNPPSAHFPFRFSTKYTDAETTLCYYGYRFLSADIGRWLNRDPIGERGGNNLQALLVNDCLSHIDPLGLIDSDSNAGVRWVKQAAEACFRCGPIDALNIRTIASGAENIAEETYPTPPDSTKETQNACNDIRNAYRHCVGSCNSVRRCPDEDAIQAQQIHEKYSIPGREVDSAVDTINNAVGTALGLAGENCEEGCKAMMEMRLLFEEEKGQVIPVTPPSP